MNPEYCPNCGAEVPPEAHACPQCGSCEETGWSEEAYVERLGIPSDSFDYDGFVEEEFAERKRSRAPYGLSKGWWIVGWFIVVLLGAALLLFARSILAPRVNPAPQPTHAG